MVVWRGCLLRCVGWRAQGSLFSPLAGAGIAVLGAARRWARRVRAGRALLALPSFELRPTLGPRRRAPFRYSDLCPLAGLWLEVMCLA